MTDYGHIDLWDIREELMEPYKTEQSPSMDETELEHLYEKVVAKGYRIDVRNRNCLILIRGQWTMSFKSFTEACYWALESN